MNLNSIGTAASMKNVPPGAAFLVTLGNNDRCIGIVVHTEDDDPEHTAALLKCYAPEDRVEAKLVHQRKADAKNPVLVLPHLEVDIPADLPAIHPNTKRAYVSDLWRPGALTIVGDDYRVVVAARDADLCSVSLRDGCLHWDGGEEPTALVARWRLIQRMGNEVRTVTEFSVA